MKFTLFFWVLISIPSLAQRSVPELGMVTDFQNDSLLHASGYRYLVESTHKILSPRNVSEQQFEEYLQSIKNLRVPLFACNLFIPGDLKVVGPQVDELAVLKYVEVVLQRAQKVDLKMIIWGSGGSRRIPDGFDRTKAKEQFITIAKKISALAAKYKITLALESLNRTECNFINTVKEALEIVRAIDHKNIRLCVDLYHMAKEGETAEVIVSAKEYVLYCEVAEKEGRTPPGVQGDDFSEYFIALKEINYRGKIVIECRWSDLAAQALPAKLYLQNQISAVWRN
jgi:sugar phosphate isomerase/epimerase